MIKGANPQVVDWLEHGFLKEALLGEGDYFLQDYTYRNEHDILLVVRTMLLWARDANKLEECGRNFGQVLLETCSTNLAKALTILVCYSVASRGTKIVLPCDLTEIAFGCRRCLEKLAQSQYSPEQLHRIRSAVNSLAKDMKEFRELGTIVDAGK